MSLKSFHSGVLHPFQIPVRLLCRGTSPLRCSIRNKRQQNYGLLIRHIHIHGNQPIWLHKGARQPLNVPETGSNYIYRQYSLCHTRLAYSCKQSGNRTTTIRFLFLFYFLLNRSPFSDLDMWCFLEDVQPILLTFTLQHTATNTQHTVENVTNTWQRSYS